MKLVYEKFNPALLIESHRLPRGGMQFIPPLEPRRSNPLDRYQFPQDQWQIPSSKAVQVDHHGCGSEKRLNEDYLANREEHGNQQENDSMYESRATDEKGSEHYLQVDPRCYVRPTGTYSLIPPKRPETPRLEKGYTINIDTRPSGASSLSPYRQSSFDVSLSSPTAHHQASTPTSLSSTQPEMYFTPRGSSLSVFGTSMSNTPPGSQHLSPPTSAKTNRTSSIEKKDLTVEVNASAQTSSVHSSIVQQECEQHRSSGNSSPIDKQSHSFDATNLLRPISQRSDTIVNRRTKSYEYAEDHPSPAAPPPPIIIKIPDMSQLVQAAQRDQSARTGEKNVRDDFWRFARPDELHEQQAIDRTSPDDLSADMFTSTSIDSAGDLHLNDPSKKRSSDTRDEDLCIPGAHRKSSSNLLLPPSEVRRQALRRTFEKRRNYLNQSNARREEQANQNSTTVKSSDFSSLFNNFNCKSENSSFDRSLETDFDMQSDTSSRGPNDHFTSIESSGNEYYLPEINPPKSLPSHPDAHTPKASQSPNQTFSLDWASTDGGESVIYVPHPSLQQQQSQSQRSVDLDEEINEQTSPIPHEISKSSSKFQQRSLSTNIPLDVGSRPNSSNQYLSPNISSIGSSARTASSKRKDFSQEKRHATTLVSLPYTNTTDEYQPKTSQTLQVRPHHDLRRSKSNEGQIPESSPSPSDDPPHLSSSADPFPSHSAPSTSTAVRATIPPHARHVFQKSPSVTVSSPAECFRSKRGSISFDHPTSPINSPLLTAGKSSSGTKPRLKFSLVRDPTTSSLGSNSSNNSMLLLNDCTIDEKTDRIINEFLKQDHTEKVKNNDDHHRPPPKRQSTFDETMITNHTNRQKQTRAAFIKQRPHSFMQTDLDTYSTAYPPARFQHAEETYESHSHQSTVRRDNGITIDSPAIIVTGYDSGS